MAVISYRLSRVGVLVLLLALYTFQLASSYESNEHKEEKKKTNSYGKCNKKKKDLLKIDCEDHLSTQLGPSTFVVELTGSLERITEKELRALERGFITAFEKSVSSSCPQGVRTIEDVTIVREDSLEFAEVWRARRLRKQSGKLIRIIYRVTGIYRGGRKNTRIFDDGSRRRTLGFPEDRSQEPRRTWTNSNWHPKNRSKGTDTDSPRSRSTSSSWSSKTGRGKSSFSMEEAISAPVCDCPPPSLDAFSDLYNDQIQVLRSRGAIVSVECVVGITEFVEIKCKGDETTFETDVVVTHSGDVDAITKEEIVALEKVFASEYNEQNFKNPEVCDPLFRTVDEVKIDILDVNARRLRKKKKTERNGLFSLRYRTNGRCRGCKKKTKLFDDGSRRALLPWPSTDPQLKGMCLCPERAEVRAPSTDEFRVGINEEIQYLRDINVITNVDSVEQVESNGGTILKEGEVSVILAPGEEYVNIASATAGATCGAGGSLGYIDICLLSDLSGSFNDDLANLRDAAVGIFDSVNAATLSTRFGVAGFSDYGKPFAYRLFSSLSEKEEDWLMAIFGLEAKKGGDLPESQYDAIVGAARGLKIGASKEPDCGWSDDLTVARTLVVTTDATFHRPGDGPDYKYGFASTVKALSKANNIRVLGLKAPGAGEELDKLANATGGTTQPLSSDGSNIASAILSALSELPCQIMPVAVECGKLRVSFDPTITTVPPGGTATFAETYSVPASARSGTTYTCEVQFSANGQVIERHDVTVMVP